MQGTQGRDLYWEHHEYAMAEKRLEVELFSRRGTGDGQEVEMAQDR